MLSTVDTTLESADLIDNCNTRWITAPTRDMFFYMFHYTDDSIVAGVIGVGFIIMCAPLDFLHVQLRAVQTTRAIARGARAWVWNLMGGCL